MSLYTRWKTVDVPFTPWEFTPWSQKGNTTGKYIGQACSLHKYSITSAQLSLCTRVQRPWFSSPSTATTVTHSHPCAKGYFWCLSQKVPTFIDGSHFCLSTPNLWGPSHTFCLQLGLYHNRQEGSTNHPPCLLRQISLPYPHKPPSQPLSMDCSHEEILWQEAVSLL